MTTGIRHRLVVLAHGRSGDKGDLVNIGVIGRRAEWYAILAEKLSADRVERWLEPLGIGPVERFELPNLGALNFLVRRALDGGGSMNLRLDAQGKTFAQALLRMPLELDRDVVESVRSHWSEGVPESFVIRPTSSSGSGPTVRRGSSSGSASPDHSSSSGSASPRPSSRDSESR